MGKDTPLDQLQRLVDSGRLHARELREARRLLAVVRSRRGLSTSDLAWLDWIWRREFPE